MLSLEFIYPHPLQPADDQPELGRDGSGSSLFRPGDEHYGLRSKEGRKAFG